MKKFILWAIGVLVVILISLKLLEFVSGHKRPSSQVDSQPMITANFVDTAKIAAVTKFRSCQGHIVVPQDGSETRSNMKHYFYLNKEFTQARRQVELFAPFDGYVSDIYQGDAEFSDRNPASRDMTFSKKKGLTARSAWGLTLLHVEPLETLKEGQSVKAGELVGYVSLELIPPYYAFDVVYAKMGTFPKKIDLWTSPYAALDSAFSHMTPTVLSQYQALGSRTATDYVINRAVRQASPCEYGPDGRSFNTERNNSWYNDWVGTIDNAA